MLHMMIYHHILKRKGIIYPLMKCTKLFYPHDLKSGGIYPHSQKIIYNAVIKTNILIKFEEDCIKTVAPSL